MHCHRHCQCHNKIASYSPAHYEHPPFNISRSAPEYLVLLLVINIRDSLYQETTGKGEAGREGEAGKEGRREGGKEGGREQRGRE